MVVELEYTPLGLILKDQDLLLGIDFRGSTQTKLFSILAIDKYKLIEDLDGCSGFRNSLLEAVKRVDSLAPLPLVDRWKLVISALFQENLNYLEIVARGSDASFRRIRELAFELQDNQELLSVYQMLFGEGIGEEEDIDYSGEGFKDFLTTGVLAKKAKESRSSIIKKIKLGKIAATKDGAYHKIPREVALDYLRRRLIDG